MVNAALEILAVGCGLTLQDQGRRGWRRFGVPSGGPMDDHAAAWANRLLDNPPGAPIVEHLLQGARFRLRQPAWLAITGADSTANVPEWKTVHLSTGDILEFGRNRSGVWVYVAIEGGFVGERILGSVGAVPGGNRETSIVSGAILRHDPNHEWRLPESVAARTIAWDERRDYAKPPPLHVWPGPQWESFDESIRARFFSQVWTVSQQSDRVGYRLRGDSLPVPSEELLSEPTLAGSIQVPPDGQPLVLMRDGPTVGGYPKLGVIEPADLSWLAQCRPGQFVRFVPSP